MNPGRFATLALVISVFAGRAVSATAADSLAENYAKWQAHRPERYAFTYMTSCHFCAAPRWRVQVDGDSVMGVTNKNPNDPARHEPDLQYYSMDSIFARIKAEIDSTTGAAVHYNIQSIRYHPQLGYPESTSFVPDGPVMDADYTLYLTEFEDNTVAIGIPPRPHAGSSQPGPGGAFSGRDLAGRSVLRRGVGPVFSLPR